MFRVLLRDNENDLSTLKDALELLPLAYDQLPPPRLGIIAIKTTNPIKITKNITGVRKLQTGHRETIKLQQQQQLTQIMYQ
jgi:hypothetical protein